MRLQLSTVLTEVSLLTQIQLYLLKLSDRGVQTVFLFIKRKRAHEVSILKVIIHFHRRHPYKYLPSNSFCHLSRPNHYCLLSCTLFMFQNYKTYIICQCPIPSSSHLSQKQANKEISLAVIICQLTVVHTTKS